MSLQGRKGASIMREDFNSSRTDTRWDSRGTTILSVRRGDKVALGDALEIQPLFREFPRPQLRAPPYEQHRLVFPPLLCDALIKLVVFRGRRRLTAGTNVSNWLLQKLTRVGESDGNGATRDIDHDGRA